MQSFMKKVKGTAVATPSFLMFYELDTPGRVEFYDQPWSKFAASYFNKEVSHGSTT
jgi:hypothetical protein